MAARSVLTANNTISWTVLRQTAMVHAAAQPGAVLGASTAIALHSLCVIPQLVQQNQRRSPMVRGDQGSESIDESSITSLQTGHGRLKSSAVISWSSIWAAESSVSGTFTIRYYRGWPPGAIRSCASREGAHEISSFAQPARLRRALSCTGRSSSCL